VCCGCAAAAAAADAAPGSGWVCVIVGGGLVGCSCIGERWGGRDGSVWVCVCMGRRIEMGDERGKEREQGRGHAEVR